LRAAQYNLEGLGLETQGLKNSKPEYQFLMGRDKEPSSRLLKKKKTHTHTK